MRFIDAPRAGTSGRQLLSLLCIPLLLAAAQGLAHGQTIPNCGTVGSKSNAIKFDQGSGTAYKGIGMVAPIRAKNGGTTDADYLMVPFSKDDGKGLGGIRFLDLSSMTGSLSGKSPAVVGQKLDQTDIREVHGMGFTEMFGDDWKTVVVPSTKGFFVYDIDNIAAVSQKAHYQIMSSSSGGSGSAATCSGSCVGSFNAAPSGGTYNYDNGVVWHLAVAAPYIYVANAENGLNVYKFGSAPGTISWVKRYDSSVFGGQRVSQVWAFGRVLVVGAVEVGAMFTVMDISDPANPVKKATLLSGNGAERVYGLTMNGYRIYGAGKDDNTSNGGTNNIQIYDITFDANNVPNGISKKASMATNICGEGGYLTVQDGYVHGGYSDCYEKWNANNPTSMSEVSPSNATLGITGSDLDFATHIGNMVFLGNDHESSEAGSLLLCHAGADTTAPAVNAVSPRDGSTDVPVTSMIGLSFSDQLRMSTITSANVYLRKQGTTAAIAGHYSYWLNLLNFAPAANLDAGTIYEIVVTSGLKDLLGNSAAAAVYDFTTAGGAPPPPPPGNKIASLTVHDTANASGWSIQTNLATGSGGSHPWSDYANTYVAGIDSGVSSLAGKEWIRVKAASKNYTGGPQATITLSATSNVYIMVDDRWGTAPAWTSGWTNTNANVTVWESSTKPSLPFSVFKKTGVSGSVTVPAIGANTAYDYFIVVE